MKLPSLIRNLLLSFFLLGVVGCGVIIPLPGPDHLHLVAVHVVNSKEEEAFNNSYLLKDAPPEIILKFSVSSTTDIMQYAVDRGMFIENQKFLCDRNKPNQLDFFGNVYWKKYEVDDKDKILSPEVFQERAHTSLFVYDIYQEMVPFKPEEKDTSTGAENYTKDFNLWRNQEDICVRIDGAERSLGLTYFFTNTVRIPKEAIRNAINDYRKAHPDVNQLPNVTGTR